jgi:hypothetical protein
LQIRLALILATTIITGKSGFRFDYLVFLEESGRNDIGSRNILVTLLSCIMVDHDQNSS